MPIIAHIVITDAPNTTLAFLWLGVLLLLIGWLLLRRWRQHVGVDSAGTDLLKAVEPTEPTPQNPTLTPQTHRQLIATMLGGGLLLVVLGQLAFAHLPIGARWAVGGVMVLGGALFLWAGSRVRPDGLASDWVSARLHQLGQRLGVVGWQTLLLLLAVLLTFLAWLAAGDLWLAHRWDVSVVAWLLAIGFMLLGGVPLTEYRFWLRRDLGLVRWEWWLLLGLIVGAWLLRGTAVTQFPNTFSGDEGSAGLHAALFVRGQANNWFTIGWFSFPSFYYALQSVFIDLFGQTIEAVRYFAALGGVLAVVATYFLARVMFGRGTAVPAALLMMGSHYHIHMSRIGLNNIWDSLFVALVLAGVWLGWRTGRRLPWLLAGVALGLGQYFYVSVRVLPLLLLIWLAGLWWRRRVQWQQQLVNMLLCAGTAVVTVLPLGIYFATHWAEFQAPLNRVTIMGERMTNMAAAAGVSEGVIVLRQMGQAALGFTHEPLQLLYAPGVPLLLPMAASLFLLGFIWGVLRLDGRFGLLLLPILSVIFLSGFSQDPPASQRFILALPSVMVLVALPLGLVGGWLRQFWPAGREWVGLGTAVLLIALVLIDITFYFGSLYESYTLGGDNTVVATKIAYDLQDEPETPDVYFFGFPRMGYFSLATIPYLAPNVQAVDLVEPLTAPPDWQITQPTMMIFLPERLDELRFVQEAWENGRYEEIRDENNRLLYAVYRIEP
ncbi:ArnT family glycosyltransferase [Candidatus Leptofilum sp.]|uniref:ArnT family glycosyltransferase n=1 Tax=Candidatus Leptofilum sp. TaxID=3241576 RepID=UPI003B5BBC71